MTTRPPRPDPANYLGTAAYEREHTYRDVYCPTCHQPARRPCRTPSGEPTLAHAARRRAAPAPWQPRPRRT